MDGTGFIVRSGGLPINADKEWMCDRQIVPRRVTVRHASHAQARCTLLTSPLRDLEVDNTSSTAHHGRLMDVLGVVQFGRGNLNHARRHLFESSKMIRRIFVDNTILLLERTGLS